MARMMRTMTWIPCRFLRELRDLKMSGDYTSCDPTKLGDWLVEVGPEFAQYTYQMIQAGVDKQTLRSLNHDHLSGDCAIANGIHRMKILSKIEGELSTWFTLADLRSALSCLTVEMKMYVFWFDGVYATSAGVAASWRERERRGEREGSGRETEGEREGRGREREGRERKRGERERKGGREGEERLGGR